jgi:predicted dehydrogenase
VVTVVFPETEIVGSQRCAGKSWDNFGIMTHSVLIVGLGQIGFGYDAEKKHENVALSHARAFYDHPEFWLAGGVDPSQERRDHFSRLYDCYASGDLEEALAKIAPDIVVIAAPTEHP